MEIDQDIKILQMQKDQKILFFFLFFSECFHQYLRNPTAAKSLCQCAASQIRNISCLNNKTMTPKAEHCNFTTIHTFCSEVQMHGIPKIYNEVKSGTKIIMYVLILSMMLIFHYELDCSRYEDSKMGQSLLGPCISGSTMQNYNS